MAKRQPTSHWIIRGYESAEKIYERKVKAGVFSERRIEILLMALSAKQLTFDEIVGACAKKKTKLRNELLTVQRETTRYMLWCGKGRYFTAEIAQQKRIKVRKA